MPLSSRLSTIALIGNPNTGKSTLFTALAGIHQRVGNYPGVTVEKKTGRMDCEGLRCDLVDLPGLYSLAARSRDEMVSVDVLLGREPGSAPIDVVLCVVDASNLQRNLYLLSQVLELGLPTVVALNMLDVAASQGLELDVASLEAGLGVPVIATQAHKRIGVDQVRKTLVRLIQGGPRQVESPLPEPVRNEARQLGAVLPACRGIGQAQADFLAQRLLLDMGGHLERTLLAESPAEACAALYAARDRLQQAGLDLRQVEVSARYAWSQRLCDRAARRSGPRPITWTDKIDRILTHRFLGTAILALVMLVVFQGVFVWAEPAMDWIDWGVSWSADAVESRMEEGALRSLLVDGAIRGVGGVFIFLPQIAILFFFIAILEDCGYLARAAYLMDRLMSRVGLSGKSFLPMLSSFACAIPGVMAARVVENERDRLTTILVAPLLTCSARLPVYAMLIGAFIPARRYLNGWLSLQGLTLAGLYLLGIVAAVCMALIFKRTLLRGASPPFLMELPSYKLPSLTTALYRLLERVLVFLRCAGTLILAVSVLVWAAIYYPHDSDELASLRSQRVSVEQQLATSAGDSASRAGWQQEADRLRQQWTERQQRQSILGRLGRWIEPVVRPLGWDWRIGCAVIASFPAREVVVATLGVIFNESDGDASDEEAESRLQDKLREASWEGTDRPLFGIPVALSIMVFFALCAQCAATLAVIRRETNSWRWPAFTFAYMTCLAYVGALVTYQCTTWLGWS